MSEKVELLKKIELYRASHPETERLTDEQIISVMVENGILSLSEAEKISVFGEQSDLGLSDSVSIKPSSFMQGKAVIVQLSDGKTYNLNETLTSRINNVASDLKKAEDNNGFIGKGWSWFKNATGIGDSSDKVREAQEAEKKLLAQFNSNEQKRPEIFKELTGVDYTPENLEKFIKGEIKLKSEQALSGYKEGQEMASDVAGDIVSGIAAVGIYTVSVAAAPFSGGASIAVGVAAATASGALIKAGVKAADTIGTDREYTFDDFKHDAVTGGFSGAIAPVTGGMGGAAGKTVATRLGIQAIKQTGKAAAAQGTKSGIKTALLNPTGYEYIGGNVLKRGLAVSAEMATDGAVGGAVDNAFRTAYDGGSAEEVLEAAGEGFVGGAIMSPVIGGGMKGAGVAFNRIKGIDEFSSLVTNCKNLGDEDLLNLYQYYKSYEQECIKNNKPVPDMKKAGFGKLMEEINSRGLNVDGSTPPPNPLPQGAGVNESAPLEGRAPNGNQAGVNKITQSEAGAPNGNPAGVNEVAQSEVGAPNENPAGVTSAEEIAPFAKHLEQTPDIQDLTNPEIKRVQLENGEFDENGNFISDGTYTVTESGNPLAKNRTFKRYPEGDRSIAQNMDELLKQIQEQSGKQKLEKYEIDTIKRFVNEHPEISVPELSEILNDYKHITKLNPMEMFGYKGLSNIKDLKQFKTNLSEYDKFITALKGGGAADDLINKLSHLRMEYFTESMAQINPEDFKKNLEFFKTLDASLSSGLTRYDYDVLLEPHSDKYFERIQAALEFNRFMDNAPISNSAKVKIGPDAKYFENYTDEKFAQILKNIALVKDMADKNFENHHLMSYILDDKQGLYTNSVEKFRQMLGENFDYDYFSKIYNIYSPEVAAAIINAFSTLR